MTRVVAVVVMAVLGIFGFISTASASQELTPEQEALFKKCEAEFADALSEFLADHDEVELFQFDYSWNDLWTQYEEGMISDKELIAGLDEITGGLFSEFLECLGFDRPVKPDNEPVVVPTSVPAGHDDPDTGAGVTIALITFGLAATAATALMARRLLKKS